MNCKFRQTLNTWSTFTEISVLSHLVYQFSAFLAKKCAKWHCDSRAGESIFVTLPISHAQNHIMATLPTLLSPLSTTNALPQSPSSIPEPPAQLPAVRRRLRFSTLWDIISLKQSPLCISKLLHMKNHFKFLPVQFWLLCLMTFAPHLDRRLETYLRRL